MQIALFSLGYFKARAKLPMICTMSKERAKGERKITARFEEDRDILSIPPEKAEARNSDET